MMRTSSPIKKSILPYVIIVAVAVASCGSYQTSYGDGIYEDSVVQRRNRNVAPQQPRTVNNPNDNNQNYKSYFGAKSKQYEGKSSDIFTDIDSYSSSTPSGERSGDAPQNQKTNHPGWGGGVTDVYFDSGFNYPVNYDWGMQSGYWAMNAYNANFLWNSPSWAGWNWTRWNTFNNRPWGYGWNNWGWNNWGWNNGFYGSFWGYGNVWVNNGFYCPSDYYGIPSNAYVMPSNIYVANRTRRGLYNTRSARNYNTPTNSTYNTYASRRGYRSANYNAPNLVSSKSRNQITPAESRRQNYNLGKTNTAPKTIRQNNTYSTRNTSSFNRRNSNVTTRRSSSNTFRSRNSSPRVRSSISRPSPSRSSSVSRRSGGRQ